MTAILDDRGVARLREFTRGHILLAFDFDGTLAPIVAHPPDAQVRRETCELLHEVVRRYPVAVISGRSVEDVENRLRGVHVGAIVGNHGIEPSSFMQEAADEVARWAPQLTAALGEQPGIVIENKQHSLSVHYRQAPSQGEARAAIHDAVTRLPGDVRLMEGIKVVNVVPACAPTKGDALLRLKAQFGVEGALFVGDDVTDEDAFAVQDPERCIGIRIGAEQETRAHYRIPTQGEIDRLLAILLDCRPDVAG